MISNKLVLNWLLSINKDAPVCNKWMSIMQLYELFQSHNKDERINYGIFSRRLSIIDKNHKYLDIRKGRLEIGSNKQILYLIHNIKSKSYTDQYISEPPTIRRITNQSRNTLQLMMEYHQKHK